MILGCITDWTPVALGLCISDIAAGRHGGQDAMPAGRVENGATGKPPAGAGVSASANFAKPAGVGCSAGSTSTGVDPAVSSADAKISGGTKRPHEGSIGCAGQPAGSDKKVTAMGPPERRKRKLWTTEEDEALLAAVEKCGEGNWTNILKGAFTLERTAAQLSQRWALIRKRKDLLAAAKARRVASSAVIPNPTPPITTTPATDAALASLKSESVCATTGHGRGNGIQVDSGPQDRTPGRCTMMACALSSTSALVSQTGASIPASTLCSRTSLAEATRSSDLPVLAGKLEMPSGGAMSMTNAAEQTVQSQTLPACGTLSAMSGAASNLSASAAHAGHAIGTPTDGTAQGMVAPAPPSAAAGVRTPMVVGVSASSSWGWQNTPMHAPGGAVLGTQGRGGGHYSSSQPSQPAQPLSTGVSMPSMAVGVGVGMPYQMGMGGSIVSPAGKPAITDASDVRNRTPNLASCLQGQPALSGMTTAATGKEGGRGRGSGSGGKGNGSTSAGRLPAGGRVVAPGVMVMSAAAAQAASVGGSEMWSAAAIAAGRGVGKVNAGVSTSSYTANDVSAGSTIGPAASTMGPAASATASAGNAPGRRQGAGRGSTADQSVQVVPVAAAAAGSRTASPSQAVRIVKSQQPTAGKGVLVGATSGTVMHPASGSGSLTGVPSAITPVSGMARGSVSASGRGASRGSSGSGHAPQQPSQPGIPIKPVQQTVHLQNQHSAGGLTALPVSLAPQLPQQSILSTQHPSPPQQLDAMPPQPPPTPMRQLAHVAQQKPSQVAQPMGPPPHHPPPAPNLPTPSFPQPQPSLQQPASLPCPPLHVVPSVKSPPGPLQTQPQVMHVNPLSAATLANKDSKLPPSLHQPSSQQVQPSPLPCPSAAALVNTESQLLSSLHQPSGVGQEQVKNQSGNHLAGLGGAQGQTKSSASTAVHNNTVTEAAVNQTASSMGSGEPSAELVRNSGAGKVPPTLLHNTKGQQSSETASFIQASGNCSGPSSPPSLHPLPSLRTPIICSPPPHPPPPPPPPSSPMGHAPASAPVPYALSCDHRLQGHTKQSPQDRVCPAVLSPPAAPVAPNMSSANMLLPQLAHGREDHAEPQHQTGKCFSEPRLSRETSSHPSEIGHQGSLNRGIVGSMPYAMKGSRSESQTEGMRNSSGQERVPQSGGERNDVSDFGLSNIGEPFSLPGEKPVLPAPGPSGREIRPEPTWRQQRSDDSSVADVLLPVALTNLGEGRLLLSDQKQLARNAQNSPMFGPACTELPSAKDVDRKISEND
ncbi:hypothetical protein CBR_g9135 [Chara braunii]|uniref:Uncharacterized protein n=1 Tax=Chara braunii TaxID=69332 RepID=A0A388KNV2_CHABU|nr:hypothetical protein CBR_g9135 [Chara braunii]|eukprot:GBG71724.1 hypothetical protein CBR_g9135 [Chara braunii]